MPDSKSPAAFRICKAEENAPAAAAVNCLADHCHYNRKRVSPAVFQALPPVQK